MKSHKIAMADGEMLGALAWRLGREAGRVRRILSDNSISWGFYFDHDPNTPVNASVPGEAHSNSKAHFKHHLLIRPDSCAFGYF